MITTPRNGSVALNSISKILTNIIVLLTEDGNVSEFNPAAESYFNTFRPQVLGAHFGEFLKRSCYQCPEIFFKLSVLSVTGDYSFDHVVAVFAGDLKYASFVLYSLSQLGAGESGYILIGTDRTAEKVQEKIGRNQRKHIESIIDSIAGNHWWKDRQGNYLGINSTLVHALGLSAPEQVIGKTDFDLPWQCQADELTRHDESVIAAGVAQTFEEQATGANGNVFTFLVTKTPLRDEFGNIIGTVGTSMDISERKEMEAKLRVAKEQAEQANQAKTKFIANISHDLRTPLSGMIGIAEILSTRLVGEDKEMINNFKEASQYLLCLLNDIIQYSKLQEQTSVVERLSIRKIIGDVRLLLHAAVLEKKLKFTVHVAEDMPLELVGDRARLQRVILNLLGNAIKFTREGEIGVDAKVDRSDENTVWVQFSVTDTGIGIPKEELTNIFERFICVQSANRSQVKEGAGLGLNIVQQFVGDMKGSIHVESTVGEGSSFQLLIPFALTHPGDIVPVDNEMMQLSSCVAMLRSRQVEEVAQPKILLVEDDAIAQKVVRLNIESLQGRVDIAASGVEAIELFASNIYHLVLLDIGLPDMTGYDVAEAFRNIEQDKARVSVPVFVLSAQAEGDDEMYQTKCREAQVDGILQKPLNFKKTKAIVDALIGT